MDRTSEAELRRVADALKTEALRLGFFACGISTAEQLDEEAARLERWLKLGYHSSMGWMERHFDKRVDPRKLVDGTATVISVLDNYYVPEQHDADPTVGKISRYAWGDDYHDVVKEKLGALFGWLSTELGGVSGRAFVDSAPVMDKAWAQRSGLGWIGKHTNLINQRLGSWFFIGELLVDVPLPPDPPATDHCGTCTRCIDACPTDAIVEPYVVDAGRCISYATIENRDAMLPASVRGRLDGWVFGCDICQDVCPWNKFSRPAQESRYSPRPGVVGTPIDTWLELDLEEFRAQFRGSPVKRTKFDGFTRNVAAAAEQAGRH